MKIERRAALGLIASVSVTTIVYQSGRLEAANQDLQVEWRVTEEQAQVISKSLDVKRIDTYDQRNPILIGAVIMVGVALAPKVAEAIGDVYYRFKSSGGVIIDIRSKPIVISTSDRVAPGYALVVSDSGVKTIQVGGAQPLKGEDLKELIDVLISAVPKG